MGYRSSIHLGVRESPAFLLYGVDMRPASWHDWRKFRAAGDRNRASYLSMIRLEIQAKAMEAQRLLEEKDNKDRLVRQFSIGDLILIRLSSKAKKMLAAQRGSSKIMPSWSLPYRVVQVFKGGTTAYV